MAKRKNKILQRIFFHYMRFIFSGINKLLTVNNKLISLKKLRNYNCYFSPVYKIPKSIKKIKSIKKYMILYDTIPLMFSQYHPDNGKNSWYSKMIRSINKNDYYFVISESARSDFLKYCPNINPNKIFTTLLASDEKFKPLDTQKIIKAKQKYNIHNNKYVFSLCTLEPRKNLIRAVKTFIQFLQKNNINDLYFVLGGGHWDEFIGKLEQEIESFGVYQDKIIKAGYVDDEDLPALYSGAEWFVYTSMYEGFGLPPLEAMSCGCPVITSNNSSLPEVVGDAGIMIDWDSDEQHIKAYENYYFNKELREQNRQKGLERAKQFSWSKCANEILDVIRKETFL